MTDVVTPVEFDGAADHVAADASQGAHDAAARPSSPLSKVISQALTLRAMQSVELEVDVVIGRARLTLGELLTTRPRQTIVLDRALHSPAEVMVNGTLFAKGELVAVNDSELGVQITEIVSSQIPEGPS